MCDMNNCESIKNEYTYILTNCISCINNIIKIYGAMLFIYQTVHYLITVL